MAQDQPLAVPPRSCYHLPMNSPIDIPFRTRGRAAKPITFCVTREIDSSDLDLMHTEKGSKAPALKRLGDRHHALARCLSSGMKEGDAAIACGYVLSRVSILKEDPAFKELLEFYREDVDKQYRDMHARLAGISADAADELHERLEAEMQAEEKNFSVGQLLEVIKLGADRTGHGPQSNQNVNVNVNLANRLEQARRRVNERKQSGVLIEQGE